MKYHLVIISDNVQDHAGGRRRVTPLQSWEGTKRSSLAISATEVGMRDKAHLSLAVPRPFTSGPACPFCEFLSRLGEGPPHI